MELTFGRIQSPNLRKQSMLTVDFAVRIGGDAQRAYSDYYPFGKQMPARNLVGSSDGRYKYTSKERDTETGSDCGLPL